MNKLVHLEDVIEVVRKCSVKEVTPAYMLIDKAEVMAELMSLPPAQSERKKGEWLANGDIPKECPFCGEDWDKYVFGDIWYTDELPKFCPNCGEDMRGEQE